MYYKLSGGNSHITVFGRYFEWIVHPVYIDDRVYDEFLKNWLDVSVSQKYRYICVYSPINEPRGHIYTLKIIYDTHTLFLP